MQHTIQYKNYVLEITSTAVDARTNLGVFSQYIATKVTLKEAMRAIYDHRRGKPLTTGMG